VRRGFPLALEGQTIGLLGGSFDPAHAGHAHVAETARARLGLLSVWWLVSPQNPLKPQSSPLAERLASAAAIARGRAMRVTDLETRLGLAYTVETLTALKRLYPGVRFVWLMGGDSLASVHRWKAWRRIAALAPICVVSRPGAGPRALFAPFARQFATRRRDPVSARGLARARPPAWVYLNARHNRLSSTALRRAQLAARRS
jgi:nicotinate-nucleotide adenylyltransferase